MPISAPRFGMPIPERWPRQFAAGMLHKHPCLGWNHRDGKLRQWFSSTTTQSHTSPLYLSTSSSSFCQRANQTTKRTQCRTGKLHFPTYLQEQRLNVSSWHKRTSKPAALPAVSSPCNPLCWTLGWPPWASTSCRIGHQTKPSRA